MTVYVDAARIRFGRYRMNHMMADSTEELMEMAERLGLRAEWLQKAGQPDEHFDIASSKRQRAIRLGACPVAPEELVSVIRQRRG